MRADSTAGLDFTGWTDLGRDDRVFYFFNAHLGCRSHQLRPAPGIEVLIDLDHPPQLIAVVTHHPGFRALSWWGGLLADSQLTGPRVDGGQGFRVDNQRFAATQWRKLHRRYRRRLWFETHRGPRQPAS